MSAITLALEALRSVFDRPDTPESYDAMMDRVQTAIAALEAETGEPVAWVEPEHLREMHKLANPCWQTLICCTSNNSGSKVPLYVIPQEAAPPSAVPYAWTVSASGRMWFGKFAEHDARIEATHCGGTVAAFPLYTVPAEPVAWCGVSKSTLPIYRGKE